MSVRTLTRVSGDQASFRPARAPGAATAHWRRWRDAMEHALYGGAQRTLGAAGAAGTGSGFFTREMPAAHFRTSVSASPLFASAVTRLLCRTDAALGHPEALDLVDIGAGGGELLAGVLARLPTDTADRVRCRGVERRARPAGLDPRIEWSDWADWRGPPARRLTGLLFANEWLDNVPLDIAESRSDGSARYVRVAQDGTESLDDGPLEDRDADWLRRWWPLTGAAGERAEIGRTRDEAWATAHRAVGRGLAVAVDYGHVREERPPHGTLAAYRDGRAVVPVPDGSCDLTAHVALDSAAVGPTARLLTQRSALHQLGVRGERPPLARASSDPAGYVRALASASAAAELTATGGLGDFRWLVEPVGITSPLD